MASTPVNGNTKEQQALVERSEKAHKTPTRFGVRLNGFDEAWRMAVAISRSDLAPKDYRDKPENCFIAMQMGAELGLSPMASLRSIATINGRPSVWGDGALAIVQSHPDYETHQEFLEGTGDAKTAVFKIKRRGHELHIVKFSVADAKQAKLWGKRGRDGQDTPWITYPDRMLQMRARGWGLRDKFADALCGLSIAEEAMDIPSGPTIEAQPDVMATVAAQLPTDLKRASETAKEQPSTIDASTVAAAQEKLEERRKEPPVDPPPVENLNQPTGKDLFGSIVGE